jgi:hypothetical protein
MPEGGISNDQTKGSLMLNTLEGVSLLMLKIE